jgi:small subunit ribosomal protein S17e
LGTDFQTNKKICEEAAVIPSKRLRNKIAGFVTHLMWRISKGPVIGISLKLQEEERERRENVIPDVSFIEELLEQIEVDDETDEMVNALGFGKLKGVSKIQVQQTYNPREHRPRREKGEKPTIQQQ